MQRESPPIVASASSSSSSLANHFKATPVADGGMPPPPFTPLALEGFLPSKNPLVGSLLHAPSSTTASSHYFHGKVETQAEWSKRKALRNNPFTGTFHVAPGKWKPTSFRFQRSPPVKRSTSGGTGAATTVTKVPTLQRSLSMPSTLVDVDDSDHVPTPPRPPLKWWTSPPSPSLDRDDTPSRDRHADSDSDTEAPYAHMGDTGGSSYTSVTFGGAHGNSALLEPARAMHVMPGSGVYTVGRGPASLVLYAPPPMRRPMRSLAFSADTGSDRSAMPPLDMGLCGPESSPLAPPSSTTGASTSAGVGASVSAGAGAGAGPASAGSGLVAPVPRSVWTLSGSEPVSRNTTPGSASSQPLVMTFGKGRGGGADVSLLTPLGDGAHVWGAVRHLLSPSHISDDDKDSGLTSPWLVSPPSPSPSPPVPLAPPSRFAFHLGVQWYAGDTLDGKYEVNKQVGMGNFAVVRLCQDRGTKRKLAVKTIRKRNLFTADERESVLREVAIHSTMHHANIIQLVDVLEDEDAIHLVLERAPGRDLQSLMNIRASPQFSETVTRVLFEQLLEALDYIHNTRHVIHCDIKPDNILFGKALQGADDDDDDAPFLGLFDVAKVCDFGNARRARDARYYSQTKNVTQVPFSSVTGTMGYIAPEILERQHYGTAVDMWSLGVLLFQMLGGYKPFTPYTSCLTKAVEFPDIKWKAISPEAKDLCKRLLEVNPAKRISVKRARKHPWFETTFLTKPLPPPSPISPTRTNTAPPPR